MVIAVRYQSRGGNTRGAAEAIAKAAGVTAASIDTPLPADVDILFVGGGVYAWSLDDALKAFLEKLDAKRVKSVAAFTTAGLVDGTNKITKIAQQKGIKVLATLPLRVLARNHAFATHGNGDTNPAPKQAAAIDAFVAKALKA